MTTVRLALLALTAWSAVIGWHVFELKRVQWQRDRIEAVR